MSLLRAAVRPVWRVPLRHPITNLHYFKARDPNRNPGTEGLPKSTDPEFDWSKVFVHKYNSYLTNDISQWPLRTHGYRFDHPTAPVGNAMSFGELHAYLDCTDMFKKYTFWECFTHALKTMKFNIYGLVSIILFSSPLVFIIMWCEQFEPNELIMDADEFWNNYWWNYYGARLDHHKYMAYLEERRAYKYRGVPYDKSKYENLYNFDRD
eukprot:GDKH01007194.1.p1 GENE.GDKH01007194.1~~GDKH01007194.1.p1  ORF type:complete len:209 (+),score=24.71 GDKH01007194.1:155-781(+)